MPNLTDLLAKPFADGGRGPASYDCWGLAREVWRRYTGEELQDYRIAAMAFSEISEKIEEETAARWDRQDYYNPPVPSVVVIRLNCRFGNHVGIYIGSGKFIHAREGPGVSIERMDDPKWRRLIMGYYTPRR